MDQFIQFINTSEGRDKGGKIVQYASRFIHWHQQGFNDATATSFNNLQSK